MKIITLCGSLKLKKEMMIIAEKLALEGNCIITPVYPVLENYERTEEQLIKLKESHFKKIELSDAILVVNVNGYMGDSTKLEIEYARKMGKEIIFYVNGGRGQLTLKKSIVFHKYKFIKLTIR